MIEPQAIYLTAGKDRQTSHASPWETGVGLWRQEAVPRNQIPYTMPTIAEIVAAKKAAAANGTLNIERQTSNIEGKKKETLSERIELDALDARLAPVKPEAAASARKTAGLILNREMPALPNGEPRGQATKVAGPDVPRSLGSSDGEGIDVTPLDADACIKDWHKAVNAFATDLCIMRDPLDPQRAWLAVRLEDEPLHPLLIKDLLIYDHPMAERRPNEPF